TRDFDSALQEKKTLVDYPGKDGGFAQDRLVGAQKFNRITAPIKSIAEIIFDQAKALLLGPADDTIRLPATNGIYIVRALGPAFSPSDEANFVSGHYHEERVRVLMMNLTAVVLELVGLAIDVEQI